MANSLYRLPAFLSSCAESAGQEGLPAKRRPSPLVMDLLEPLEALAGLVYKNTFIEFCIPRSPSLAAHFRHRAAKSCPAKRTGEFRAVAREVQLPSPCRILTPQTPPAEMLSQYPCESQGGIGVAPQECGSYHVADGQSASLPYNPCHSMGYSYEAATTQASFATGPSGSPCSTASPLSAVDTSGLLLGPGHSPPVLQCMGTRPLGVPSSVAARVPPPPPPPPTRWDDSLAFGSPTAAAAAAGLPSLGSQGHALSRCRPCAFLHTKGCSSGYECKFCHLCEPGERKRRIREKREKAQQDKVKRIAAKAARANAAGGVVRAALDRSPKMSSDRFISL